MLIRSLRGWMLLCCCCTAAALQAQTLPAGNAGMKALLLKRRIDDSVAAGRLAAVPVMAHEAIGLACGSGADSLLPMLYLHLGDAYDGNRNDSAAFYYRKALATWKNPKRNKRIYILQSLIYSYTNQDLKDSIPPYIHALEEVIAPLPDTSRTKLKVINTLATSYSAVNDYAQAVQLFRKVIRLALPLHDSSTLANAFINTGTAYNETGNDSLAIYYTQQALPYLSGSNSDVALTAYGNLCDYYSGIGRPEEARRYLNIVEQLAGPDADEEVRMFILLHRAINMVNVRQYGPAAPLLAKSLRYYEQQPGSLGLINTLFIYAQQDTALHDYKLAEKHLLHLHRITQDKSAQAYLAYTLQLLGIVYSRLGDYKAAFSYQQQYIALNNRLRSEQAAHNFLMLEAEYQTYRKEEQISQLSKAARIKDLELQAARRERLWYIGLAVLLTALFGGAYYLRQQRSKADMRQLRVSLEMKALRSQMNPHFIFNSLNSIQKYIWENRQADAAEYLTRFARLIRLVLENSRHAAVPLSTELAALRLYIDMEHRRSSQQFDYSIQVADDIDTELTRVPPLLIQPYAENAIWHGLSHKEDRGRLTIAVTRSGDALIYTITDDGIGREAAGKIRAAAGGQKSSLAMNISSERIAWLRRDTGRNASVTVTDLYDAAQRPAGTTVVISLPLILTT